MALKKPTDLFGVHKVSQIVEEIDKFQTLEETHELTGGTPGGNFSVSFSASMIDEIFKNLQTRIEKTHQADIQGVYEELTKCKKLVNTSQLKVEGRVNTLKKELYERIDDHIAHAQQTIQELYHTEIRQIKKLSSDIQLVEKYIATHSNKIVELRKQINEELQKRPVAIDRIESKIDLVAESYQNLSENLNEGLLNEPVTSDAISNTEFVTSDQLKDHYRLFLNRIEEQLSTVGGGGEVNLKYLDDVVGIATNAAAYDGKFLRYNHSIGKFEFVSNNGNNGESWDDSFESNVIVGIHTLTNVAINTSIISRSRTGNLGLNPLTIQGNDAYAGGIHTCNTLVFTNKGDLGLGTTNPANFGIWNTFTLDGNKSSSSGSIGGGDIVFRCDGKQFLDLYTTKSSSEYAGIGFTESMIAAFSRPFEITGYSDNAPVGTASSMSIFGFNIGVGTYNPRKTNPGQDYGLDVYDSDLYVGIGTTTGVVLTSSNGNEYRIIVDDSGNITTTDTLGVSVSGISTFASGIDVTGHTETDTLNVSGISTFTTVYATSFSGNGNDIVHSTWTLGANGSNHYTFTGPGGLSNTDDPKIYLARGQTYKFVNNSGGHPFRIQSTTGLSGTPYSNGVTNNAAGNGVTLTFDVPFDAPNTLYYQCTSHSSMGNTIIIYPDLSP